MFVNFPNGHDEKIGPEKTQGQKQKFTPAHAGNDTRKTRSQQVEAVEDVGQSAAGGGEQVVDFADAAA